MLTFRCSCNEISFNLAPQLVLLRTRPRLSSRQERTSVQGTHVITNGRKGKKQLFCRLTLPSQLRTQLRALALVHLVFPPDVLTVEIGSLQMRPCNYAIMFCKERKARGQDHEPLADRFAREERRAAALPKTLPRSGTP